MTNGTIIDEVLCSNPEEICYGEINITRDNLFKIVTEYSTKKTKESLAAAANFAFDSAKYTANLPIRAYNAAPTGSIAYPTAILSVAATQSAVSGIINDDQASLLKKLAAGVGGAAAIAGIGYITNTFGTTPETAQMIFSVGLLYNLSPLALQSLNNVYGWSKNKVSGTWQGFKGHFVSPPAEVIYNVTVNEKGIVTLVDAASKLQGTASLHSNVAPFTGQVSATSFQEALEKTKEQLGYNGNEQEKIAELQAELENLKAQLAQANLGNGAPAPQQAPLVQAAPAAPIAPVAVQAPAAPLVNINPAPQPAAPQSPSFTERMKSAAWNTTTSATSAVGSAAASAASYSATKTWGGVKALGSWGWSKVRGNNATTNQPTIDPNQIPLTTTLKDPSSPIGSSPSSSQPALQQQVVQGSAPSNPAGSSSQPQSPASSNAPGSPSSSVNSAKNPTTVRTQRTKKK